MEVHAIDTLSGREEPLEIDPDATVSEMMRRCGEAFGFGEDVELSVGGQRVACDGEECISNVAAFSGGCRVEVVRGVAKYLTKLRSGAVSIDSIPLWARQRRECVLAVLARVLERTEPEDEEHFDFDELYGDQLFLPNRFIPPHWVHPSLHGDKEVMLEYMRCDPNAFVLASAALRSDADVVIAALEQDPSMWRHVENKDLQEQRSVALLAVPYCANSAVWLSDKAFVLEALEKYTCWKPPESSVAWGDVSKGLQEDKEVVMKAFVHGKLNFHQLSAELQEDRHVVMNALDCGRLKFHQLSAALQEDKDVVVKALEKNRVKFGDLSEALRGDKRFVLLVFTRRLIHDFREVGQVLRGDKEVVMKALDCCELNFHQLSATLQEDKDVAFRALEKKQVRFGDLSEALRGDKKFVLLVLARRHLHDFRGVGEVLRGDKDVIMRALDCCRLKFHQLSAALQEDRQVVMKALEKNRVLFGLSEALRGDNQFVMSAFYRNHAKFGEVSKALREDKSFVMMVLKHKWIRDFQQVSEALRADKEVVMLALTNCTVRFGDLSDALRADKGFVMTALERMAMDDFHQVSEALRGDKEVVMKALGCRRVRRCDGFTSETLQADNFHQVDEALREDKEVALKALEKVKVKFEDLSKVLRADKSFVRQAMNVAPHLHRAYLSLTGTLRQDKDVALAAIARDPTLFVRMDPVLRDNLEVALPAIRGDPDNFIYAGDSVRADRQAALAAFPQVRVRDPSVLLPFASAELQADREVVLAAVRVNARNADYANTALHDVVEAN